MYLSLPCFSSGFCHPFTICLLAAGFCHPFTFFLLLGIRGVNTGQLYG
jgi:hypothetical protein